MTEFRLARPEDIDSQKKIWKACFGDTDEFINSYYDGFHRLNKTILCIYGGKTAAMLTMLPTRLVIQGGDSLNTPCLYAIATDPQMQGLGLASKLMDSANSHLLQQGASASILVPATPSLFDFYEKRGYKTVFYTDELVLSYSEMLEDTTVKSLRISPEDYNSIRREILRGQAFVDYNTDALEYQSSLSGNGGLFRVSSENNEGCAAIEVHENKVVVKELLADNSMLAGAISEISRLFKADKYIIRMPSQIGKNMGAISKPFGMMKWLSQDRQPQFSGYMGLAFD